MPFDLTALDAAALLWFLVAWVGYNLVFEGWLQRPSSLNRHMELLRRSWMERMLERDNRITDAALIGHTIHSISFFASTTVLVMAGLVGLLGNVERAHGVAMDVTFAVKTSRLLFEFKVIVLLGMAVYAFSRFTWALRQYNYLCVLIGGAPLADRADGRLDNTAEDLASVLTLAVRSFNSGLRAYYFAIAVLTWFVHPLLFIIATLWTLGMLLRRQFLSHTFRAIARRTAVLYGEAPHRRP